MNTGIIRQDETLRPVVFSGNVPYSVSEILDTTDRQILEDFYTVFSENRKEIERAVLRGEHAVEGDWNYSIPVPGVGQIRDFYSFEEHVKAGRRSRGLEMIPEWYEIPVFYYSGTSCLYASGEEVRYPSYTEQLDFELEIAVVIGRDGINISSREYMDYVFGAVFVNDWSARDEQKKEMKLNLGPAKSKDFGTSIGPYVVTSDVLTGLMDSEGRIDIGVEGYVNGTRYSQANLKTIYWSFGDMIERASRDVMLHRGDIIMSGTVGTGCILELGADRFGWLRKGDEVEFRSDTLGSLRNRIV